MCGSGGSVCVEVTFCLLHLQFCTLRAKALSKLIHIPTRKVRK